MSKHVPHVHDTIVDDVLYFSGKDDLYVIVEKMTKENYVLVSTVFTFPNEERAFYLKSFIEKFKGGRQFLKVLNLNFIGK